MYSVHDVCPAYMRETLLSNENTDNDNNNTSNIKLSVLK